MLTFDPSDALQLARTRARGLHAEAAAERLRARSSARTTLATLLRLVADRVEPAPLPRRPASQC